MDTSDAELPKKNKVVEGIWEVQEVENHRTVISGPDSGKLLGKKIIEARSCSHLEGNEEGKTAGICWANCA